MSENITAWLSGRLPDDWFESLPAVSVDRDEVLIMGRLAAPSQPAGATAAAVDPDVPEDRSGAEAGRISRFREQTRAERIQIAREAEHRFDRKVSWGASCGETTTVFTTVSTPVMTRLRQPERRVLDTLVDAGVARSRSHALAWCVRLVGENSDEWLAALRSAMTEVERVRAEGPGGKPVAADQQADR